MENINISELEKLGREFLAGKPKKNKKPRGCKYSSSNRSPWVKRVARALSLTTSAGITFTKAVTDVTNETIHQRRVIAGKCVHSLHNVKEG